MNFDEAFRREAEAMFDGRQRLEILPHKSLEWEDLTDKAVIELVFSLPRNRAEELAMPLGIGLSNGSRVRFSV